VKNYASRTTHYHIKNDNKQRHSDSLKSFHAAQGCFFGHRPKFFWNDRKKVKSLFRSECLKI